MLVVCFLWRWSCRRSALAEDDGDVAEALLDARGATHRARAPATHVLVRGLVDEGGLHVERVDVHPRGVGLGVGDGALDELLDDGGGRLAGELEQLERLAGLTATDEVHDDTSFSHADAREPGNRLADHGRSLVATVVPTRAGPGAERR